MKLTQVKYEVAGAIARVSMDRTRYKNAQSLRMLEELDAAFTQASEDPAVRVIVLRGEGDVFSSGHDLGTPENEAHLASLPYGRDSYGQMRLAWKEGIEFGTRWRDIPKPTIAAVHGYVIFNAWFTMSVMDVIFADEDTRFLAGRVPFFAAAWDLGPRKTKELLFRNRFLSAREAEALGFVNRVVPAGRLDDEVMAYAAEVAEGDPHSLWIAKLAANQMQDQQGYSNYIRSVFALMRLRPPPSASGPIERIDGRRRSAAVEAVFKRGGTAATSG